MIVDRAAGRLVAAVREVRAGPPPIGDSDIRAAIARLRDPIGAVDAKVSSDLALTHSAVWACVRSIVDPVVMADVAVFAGDTKTRRTPSQLVTPAPPVIADPNPGEDPENVWEALLMSALLTGTAFGLVGAVGPNGEALSLVPVHPDHVTVNVPRPYAAPIWKVLGERVEVWPRGPLWVWKVFAPPGSPVGLSPISHAARSIRLGVEAERFGAQWFVGNQHPSGILATDYRFRPTDEDDAVAERIKERFREAAFGRDVAVLGHGLSYQPLHIPAEDSQFLATIGANVTTIARFFRVQPEIIAGAPAAQSLTYANIEQRALDHLSLAVQPWTTRMERALARLLPGDAKPVFDVDALVRVGMGERFRAYMAAVRSGWLSVNEVRAMELRDPIDGGDRFVWPPLATESVSFSFSGDDVDPSDVAP